MTSEAYVDVEAEDDEAEDYEPSKEQAEALDLSADERKLVTQPYDLGVKSISTDIQNGRIKLSIEYQRKYVWDSGKASRLIESLLLNVPIPVCYFAEDENGSYEVIDGLQRLTTIKNYLEGHFALSGLSVLSELDGKKFSELAPRDQRRLENRTIRCIVITEDSNPDIKFDVFERLNTGAATLTAQELRNSVYRGSFNDALKVLATKGYFIDLLGTSSNRRMDFEELILRFFSLTEGLQAYKPPLRQFLNTYMRTNRSLTPEGRLETLFEHTCRTVHDVLGSAPFRVPGSKNVVNKAMFDAFMVPFAFAELDGIDEAKKAELRGLVQDIVGEEEFRTAIGRATADRQRMLYRVGVVADRLRSSGVRVNLPEGLGLPDSPSAKS
ncbi:DUF262 domain-containing protein [Terracoccus luteus]|uniref:DUF262 domain-containing protein n=1 Tax=Terracoccus luteus TaxID=53356 RepID=UPI001473118E|nr:DUF262 domain-containing protein [Terracoccus luteus]